MILRIKAKVLRLLSCANKSKDELQVHDICWNTTYNIWEDYIWEDSRLI